MTRTANKYDQSTIAWHLVTARVRSGEEHCPGPGPCVALTGHRSQETSPGLGQGRHEAFRGYFYLFPDYNLLAARIALSR